MKLSATPLALFALASAGSVLASAEPHFSKRFGSMLQVRQGSQCGSGIGRCASGECCSESGYCGTTTDYCAGSQCQLDFSDGCDTFKAPPGQSTENVPRPHIGNVPYGTVLTSCTTPGMMALTFDDGPYEYTRQMLDILDDLGIKATFFVAGNNIGKGRIDDPSNPWAAILQRMYNSNHHIASHTWTHRDLNQVNSSVKLTEMIYNEMAFRNIFGWIPTYMRPPYLECDQSTGCTGLMNTLGYHIIENNIDTKDYENDDPSLIQISKDRFSSGLSSDPSSHSYITLAHDVHYQTVVNLTAYMVQTSRDRGYKLVTVGECLGDPKANWYRQVSGGGSVTATRNPASTVPSGPSTTTSYATPTKTGVISRDQTCGGSIGQTCQGSAFGNCCSFYGYCGSTNAYCGTGCDPNFGQCDPVNGGVANTTNGLCGSHFKTSCIAYGDKTCCSQYGYCGNSAAHCGTGCQKGYGKCN
ncbi:Chitin deacetylase [Cladobotryum mycophilum]|uniref:Chitin deacetylase n=1 Tax=Cladobotryum mycophilum TaxID=491253 RepID=A0ABR0SC54_9HYPO